jgi:hypothetical protein
VTDTLQWAPEVRLVYPRCTQQSLDRRTTAGPTLWERPATRSTRDSLSTSAAHGLALFRPATGTSVTRLAAAPSRFQLRPCHRQRGPRSRSELPALPHSDWRRRKHTCYPVSRSGCIQKRARSSNGSGSLSPRRRSDIVFFLVRADGDLSSIRRKSWVPVCPGFDRRWLFMARTIHPDEGTACVKRVECSGKEYESASRRYCELPSPGSSPFRDPLNQWGRAASHN